jgi:hypothetical protein
MVFKRARARDVQIKATSLSAAMLAIFCAACASTPEQSAEPRDDKIS